MVDKEVFLEILLKKVKKLPLGHYLDIRTYKRNRSILVIKEKEGLFKVIERGFRQEEFQVSFEELKKLFKKLLKIEFPRSHKIRIYNKGKYLC